MRGAIMPVADDGRSKGRQWFALLALGVCACTGRVPGQAVYLLYTGGMRGDVDAIASEVAADLHLKTSVATFPMEGGAVSHNIELYGGGFSIFIHSAADQQCYSEDKTIRFNKKIYSVIIAKTSFLPHRSRVKEMAKAVSLHATQRGAKLTGEKAQCPPTG